jgi:probable F420-dependent oxidoreductase
MERMKMKIGLSSIGFGALAAPAMIRAVVTNAERLNFSTVWAPEHVVLLDRYTSRYPYSADGSGQFLAPTEVPIGDPFPTLTYAAACTSRLRLATGICLVPEHNPLVLAKTVATVDYLSGGRFILGVGIGWLAEEFQALGIPFERRAQRTREYIEAMRRLWSDDHSSYRGEFVCFENARSYPKPLKRGKLPVWFGGESGPALRRAAEYGDGWFGLNVSPDEAASKIKRIEQLLGENGRQRSELEIAVSPYPRAITVDDLKRFRDAGADEVELVFLEAPGDERDVIRQLEKLAREFIEPASKL